MLKVAPVVRETSTNEDQDLLGAFPANMVVNSEKGVGKGTQNSEAAR
jgi:hypothetical protein